MMGTAVVVRGHPGYILGYHRWVWIMRIVYRMWSTGDVLDIIRSRGFRCMRIMQGGVKRNWCFFCCEHQPPDTSSLTGLCPDQVCSFLQGNNYSRLLLGSARVIVSLRWCSSADPELRIRVGVSSAFVNFQVRVVRVGYLYSRQISVVWIFGHLGRYWVFVGYLLRVFFGHLRASSSSLIGSSGRVSSIFESGVFFGDRDDDFKWSFGVCCKSIPTIFYA